MSKTAWETVFKHIKTGAFTVRYWDGQSQTYGQGEPEFTIVFNREPSTLKMIKDPVLTLGEAYMDGEADFEGDLDAMILVMRANFTEQLSAVAGLIRRCLSATRGVLGDQRKNIKAHYDLGNDFFSLWLDPTMSYSCAYFERDYDTLEEAQLNKIDLILRKMRLQKGMKILEIGCGWGALLKRASENYGAVGLGLTLSEEQFALAGERLKGHQVEVRLKNYLELSQVDGPFDRVISVGMFEHVGRENFGNYLWKVSELLKPGGLSMLHTLTAPLEAETNSWIKKYIFPGGYIPSLREVVHMLPDYDLHTLHIESLRRHYVRTLDIWHENFSRPEVLDKVRERFDERFIRMWSLYLRAAAASLRLGSLDIHQLVLSKGVNNDLPMTLNDVYCR